MDESIGLVHNSFLVLSHVAGCQEELSVPVAGCTAREKTCPAGLLRAEKVRSRPDGCERGRLPPNRQLEIDAC